MEYAVKAETMEGSIVTLRRGFGSFEDAEEHRVRMAQWKRVWIEPLEATNRVYSRRRHPGNPRPGIP